ncbi:hypothetical protein HPP92_006303 [Vanilla planifolia]|uniref:Proline iminopeptidase n=1 Tax=Vanilla planifolia TaxID=51239 RepID=A0A835RIG7_VANPL|nr:hypothetical protein HPP92_006303 [Vanilla planifolia]
MSIRVVLTTTWSKAGWVIATRQRRHRSSALCSHHPSVRAIPAVRFSSDALGGSKFPHTLETVCSAVNRQVGAVMDYPKETQELNRSLYSQIEPYSSGFLKVSDIHTLYWEQSGNPSGYPVVFLHGGPGGGTTANNRQFFDPEFYRIILFDQRGAGKSTPHACLEENTTWDLVSDIELLREHLQIPEWQVFGGSWGSTLALAYSQKHPDKELDWFYEGGAAAIFPDAWEPFRDFIPENERSCFMEAYHKRLNSTDVHTKLMAAKCWTTWETKTAHLIPNEETINRGNDDMFALAFARIENHFFVNKGFFPSDSHLLDNIDKIRHIKTIIVQGRYDVCCPMMSAWDLHKAWPEAEFIVVPDAGHSANEVGIAAELVAANEKLKNMIKVRDI